MKRKNLYEEKNNGHLAEHQIFLDKWPSDPPKFVNIEKYVLLITQEMFWKKLFLKKHIITIIF